MRTLLLIVGWLVAAPSFAFVAWTCTYNGVTYSVGMPCEEAIRRGITPPFKERPDPPECAGLKQQRTVIGEQIEVAGATPGRVPDEEIVRLARDFDELGAAQHRHGCKDAPPLP